MLVCIDHGNKQIKTTSRTFTSGLMESDTRPPFGDNIMFFNGKYYTLSDQRIPYIRDKTEDDRFFILTLFAITSTASIAATGLSPVNGNGRTELRDTMLWNMRQTLKSHGFLQSGIRQIPTMKNGSCIWKKGKQRRCGSA